MLRLQPDHKKIDTVFLVCLFLLFTVTAFLLVLVGARQYQATADAMDENYELRTVSSYLREKVHQHDTDAGVAVVELDGTDALMLNSRLDDKTYHTYIYYCDGALRELFVGEDAVYSLKTGQEIIALKGFSPKLLHTGLLEVTVTDTDGVRHELYLDLKAATGKDNP